MKATPRKTYARYFIAALLACMLLAAAGAGWVLFSYFYPWALQDTLRGHHGGVICVAFSPDGQTLATGGEDRTVRLWDLATRKERATLAGHTDNVVALAFSPDGNLLATASLDGSVRLWEVDSGQQQAVLLGNARPDGNGRPLAVYTVAFSPDGQLLASGGADETVRLWEVATGKQQAVLEHTMDVRSLAITPDAKLLVSRTEEGIISVWDLHAGKELRRFEESHIRFSLFRVLLGPDGKTLACNDTTKEKVKLWDIATGEERSTLKAQIFPQDSPIESMAVSPDGKVLAGRTIFGAEMAFWDLDNGKVLSTKYFPRSRALAFSPDGKILASVHGDGAVKLWDSSKLIPR